MAFRADNPLIRCLLPHLTVLVPLAVSIVCAAGALSNHGYASGFDGYYYALQTRAVAENGKLLIADNPMLFWLTGLAAVITGDAVSALTAVKICIHCTVTVALFFTVKRLTGRTTAALWAALVWTISFAGLYFTFELAKHNLGNLLVLGFFLAVGKVKKPLPAAVVCAAFFMAALATHLVTAGLVLIASAFFAIRFIVRHVPSRRGRVLFLAGGALAVAAVLAVIIAFRFADIVFFLREISPLDFLERYGIILSSPRPPVISGELFLCALFLFPLSLTALVLLRRSSAVMIGAAWLLCCLTIPLLRFDWDATAYRFLLQAPLFGVIVLAGLFTFRISWEKTRRGATLLNVIPVALVVVLIVFLPHKIDQIKRYYQPDYAALAPLAAPVKAHVPPATILVAHKGLSSLLWYETGRCAIHFMPQEHLERYARVVNGFGAVHFEEYLVPGETPPLELSSLYTLVDETLWQRFYQDRKNDIVFLGSWLNPHQSAPEHVEGTADTGGE